MSAFTLQPVTARTSLCSTQPLKCNRRFIKHRCPIRAVASDAVKPTKVDGKSKLSEPKTFDWKLQWYPVAVEEDVPTDEPYSFQLFDSSLVLLKVAKGRWTVLDDASYHRPARFSAGGIVRETLNSDVEIEREYATKVENGIIFCFFGNPELSDEVSIFLPQEAEKMKDRAVTNVWARDLNCGFENLLENIIDQEHVYHLHHGIGFFFDRKKGGKIKLQITSRERSIQSYAFNGEEGAIAGTSPPCMAYVMFDVPGILDVCISFFLRPSTRTSTTLFLVQMEDFHNPFLRFVYSLKPKWMTHLLNLTVTDGDALVLAQMESNIGSRAAWKDKWILIPNKMDALIIAYKTWMDKHREFEPWLTDSTSTTISVPESREEKLDRWISHTQHCKHCRKAWKTFKILSVIADVVAKIAAVSLTALFVSVYMGSPSIIQDDQLRLLCGVAFTLVGALASGLFLKFKFDQQAKRFVYTDEARQAILGE